MVVWCIVGLMSVNKVNLKDINCKKIYLHEVNTAERANYHFILKHVTGEVDIEITLRRMHETNFT